MAHHNSAKKKIRRDEKFRLVNRRSRGNLKTALKKFRKALDEKNVELVTELFKPTLSIIDKSVQKNACHANKADRLKSRLTKHYNKLLAEVENTAGKEAE
jgi:small subunit ribosomal protein S20